jgi:heptosyltransferase-3
VRTGRVLVVRTDRLGDVILTLPMLPVLRRCYPHAHIVMLLSTYTGEIVAGNPYVNELLWYDNGRQLLPFGSMLREIRKRELDAVVVAHPTLRLALLMFLARIPARIGSGYRYYSFLFNHRVYEHRKDARRHEVEYNLQLLRELDCQLDGKIEFALEISREDQESVDRLLRSHGIRPGEELIVLHPGSGGSAREWPSRYFAELAGLFWKERQSKVVVTGLPGDEGKADMVVGATEGSALSVVGKLRVKELAALVRSADLVIANSTGPLHIAAAVGTPVVGLYPQLRPMSAARWGPYTGKKRILVPDKPADCQDCSPERGQECACMASIPVSDVYRAASELLAEPHCADLQGEAHER